VPVKYSAGPLPEGCEPLLLMSIFLNSFTCFSYVVILLSESPNLYMVQLPDQY
jgi:hypothetical protein